MADMLWGSATLVAVSYSCQVVVLFIGSFFEGFEEVAFAEAKKP